LITSNIGLQGFEPWTSPTRTARSTKLSHSPNKLTFAIILVSGKDGAVILPFPARGASQELIAKVAMGRALHFLKAPGDARGGSISEGPGFFCLAASSLARYVAAAMFLTRFLAQVKNSFRRDPRRLFGQPLSFGALAASDMIEKMIHRLRLRWLGLQKVFPVLQRISPFLRSTRFLGPWRIDHFVEAEKEVGLSIENLQILWPAQKQVSLEPTENERKFLKICRHFNDGFYSRANIFVCEVPQAYCHIGTGLVCTRDFKAIVDSHLEYRRMATNPRFGGFKPLRPKRLSGDHYATIIDTWTYNWHHWLSDCLPRLYSLSRAYPDRRIVLLTPSGMKKDWKESLAAALPPRFEIQYLPDDLWVRVDRLILPSFVSARANYHLPSGYYDLMRKTTFERLGLPPETEPRERLYVSRASAPHRRILNEDNLIGLLSRYGFKSITPEKMAFRDMVDLYRRAEIVVGGYGANWGNNVYSGKIKNFVLYNERPSETHVFTFSKALGQEHFFLAGEEKHIHISFSVDLAEVERVLQDEMNLQPN
jgi:hypothetical protein